MADEDEGHVPAVKAAMAPPPPPLGRIAVGTSQPDVFVGTAGDDHVHGGGSIDTFVVSGSAAYRWISAHEDGYFVSGYLDDDTISEVERVQFSDRSVALDLSGDGSAGMALRFLAVVAGKEALQDIGLVGQAIALMDAHGKQGTSELLVGDGTLEWYAGALDGQSLVTLLFTNITGHAPAAPELDYYVNLVEQNNFSPAETLAFAAELEVTATSIGLVGLAVAGIAFQPWDAS